MNPGTRFKKLIKRFGYTTASKLADDISSLAVSNIKEDLQKQESFMSYTKKWQSKLSKIFNKDDVPGLKIVVHIIDVLGDVDPTIPKREIAKEIIEIYKEDYDHDDISTILISFPENKSNFCDLKQISIINQEWSSKYYEMLVKYGGLDWSDIEENYSKLEENVIDICKLISNFILNEQYINFKEAYQYAENFLQICGYRNRRLYFSNELFKFATIKSDIETSIQARAAHSWSLVTDREVSKAKNILDDLINEFESLNTYCEKTGFAKIITFENLARIAIIHGKFSEAQYWFEQQTAEVELGKQIFHLNAKIAHRYKLSISYHKGRIYFYQQDYKSALSSFQYIRKSAQKIGWIRMDICAQNWLGGIYTEIGDFKSAENLLENGLCKAMTIKSKGRLGFYHRSLAILYIKSNRYSDANFQIAQAYSIFQKLGMNNAASEVLKLINTGIAS